ncbi:MAG: hypothetical protein INF12_14650 [Methylobacterium sp.]|nr:hypothetical protein [Methylobacterium sp.]
MTKDEAARKAYAVWRAMANPHLPENMDEAEESWRAIFLAIGDAVTTNASA